MSFLTEYAKHPISNAPRVRHHLIVNKEQSEFVLLSVGWKGNKYQHGIIFHIEIQNGLIHIYKDNTDIGIADQLAKDGIPKSSIVLSFLPRYIQEETEFATVAEPE